MPATVRARATATSTTSDSVVVTTLLEPALPSDEPVPLGTGWPEVDLDAVADAFDADTVERLKDVKADRDPDGVIRASHWV